MSAEEFNSFMMNLKGKKYKDILDIINDRNIKIKNQIVITGYVCNLSLDKATIDYFPVEFRADTPITNIEEKKEYYDAFINIFLKSLIANNEVTTVSDPTNFDEIDEKLFEIYYKKYKLDKDVYTTKRKNKEISVFAPVAFHFAADGYIDQAYVIYAFDKL